MSFLFSAHFAESRSVPVAVLMRRKARILNPGEVVYGRPGETVHIRCQAEMVPSNGTLTWRRKVSKNKRQSVKKKWMTKFNFLKTVKIYF